LIFIDETWSKTNMTRLYGWAEVGHRLVDAVPHGHWNTSTFIAGLRCDGLVAPCRYVGLEMAQAFRRFGSQVTVIEAGPQLIRREDPDVADAIQRTLSEEGIGFYSQPRLWMCMAAPATKWP
jgi:hypothetical protein